MPRPLREERYEEEQIVVFLPSPRVTVRVENRGRSSVCESCRQETCQSCGRRTSEAGPGHQALEAPDQRFLLPPPPSRHPSQVSRGSRQSSRGIDEASHMSSHSRSRTVQFLDAPLFPSDSASNLDLVQDGPQSSGSTISRSEVSHISRLTADNLRRANPTSGESRRSTQDRIERFIEEQPLALMPPPSPSRSHHSSSRRSELSSRVSSSRRHADHRLIEWRSPSNLSPHPGRH
jgi:hypothetical protein